MCLGGSIPSWLKRERESGMLISDMYLETDDFKVYIYAWETFLYLLPVSVDVLDKGVGDPVPGELLASGSSK